jgi:hypothetical protein
MSKNIAQYATMCSAYATHKHGFSLRRKRQSKHGIGGLTMAEYTTIKTARTIICELCNELYPDDHCEPADCDWLRMLEEDALSCDNCKWLGKRHQKCSCCRRNNGMKDNYEGKTP